MKSKLFFLLPFIMVASCVVSYTPKYDASIAAQVSATANSNDAFIQTMIDAPNKSYNLFEGNYQAEETKITDLIAIEAKRDKNTLLYPQIINIQKLFLKFELQHSDKGTMSNAQLSIFKSQLSAAWQPLINSENLLKH